MEHEQSKIKNLRTICTVTISVVFVVSGIIVFNRSKISNIENIKHIVNVSNKNIENEEKLKKAILPLNNYMEQPNTNFRTYIKPEKVKGIYVSGYRAGTDTYINDLIRIANETEINSMVIDIKNDNGEITYKMNLPDVIEIGATRNYINNIHELIKTLKENNIYPIARIVTFRDNYLCEKNPNLAIKNTDGSIWRDKQGTSWLNPYNKDVWEYIINVSKEAALVGFKEIQFDYMLFSTDSKIKEADFSVVETQTSRKDIINEFIQYAYEQLSPLGVYISASVYGSIIDNKLNTNLIGQDYVELSKNLDYISPILYPSRYAEGSLGIEYPVLEPYNIIYNSMNLSKEIISNIDVDENKATVRPWLQDFTATWLEPNQVYGVEQVREQINAVYDSGLEEWILWNVNCNYTEDALEKEK